MTRYSGRLALQQRVLPGYRVPFFDLLAESCDEGMSLFAGLPRPIEMISSGKTQTAKLHTAQNIHLFSGGFYLCHQKGIVNWLEAWSPDSLIVEANPRNISTPSAVRWMRERGRRVIGWGLGAPPLSGSHPIFKENGGSWRGGLWRYFLSQFDAMLTYSQRGAEEYSALGFPREKIFVAHNSVSAKPDANYQLPITHSQPTILFVGRLQARKRINSLLRACAEMESKPRLIIVGDGPERAALETLARDVYPVAEFAGEKLGAEVKPYFAEADLFVLPGTGGLAVHEAMSHGLPVIVAKGDGTQDDLVREGNGWQIPPDDYGALVSTMKTALTDMARLRKMGAESFRIVSEEINIQKMAEVFVQALNAA